MKRILALAFAGMVALSFGGSAALAKTKRADKPAGSDKVLRGDVVKVTASSDAGAESQISVETGTKKEKHEVSVTLNSDTAITENGHSIKVDDLKAGDHVVIAPAEGVAKTVKVTANKQAKTERKAKKKAGSQAANAQQ